MWLNALNTKRLGVGYMQHNPQFCIISIIFKLYTFYINMELNWCDMTRQAKVLNMLNVSKTAET